ncbi:MAG: hypothetical protein ACYS8K_07270 [Planctomycetota bacterium]|jgi:hypothetical protein
MPPPSGYRGRILAGALVLAAAVAAALWMHYGLSPDASPRRSEPLPPAETPSGAVAALIAGPPESAANNRGVQLAAAGRYEEAIPHFRFAVERDADYLPGWKNLLAADAPKPLWRRREELDGSDNLVARYTYAPGYIDAVASLKCGRLEPAADPSHRLDEGGPVRVDSMALGAQARREACGPSRGPGLLRRCLGPGRDGT